MNSTNILDQAFIDMKDAIEHNESFFGFIDDLDRTDECKETGIEDEDLALQDALSFQEDVRGPEIKVD